MNHHPNNDIDMRKLLLNAGSAAMIAFSLVSVVPQANAQEVYRTCVNYNLLPAYNGEDLELSQTAEGFNFKLWSPFAQEVKVKIYKNGVGGEAEKTFDLTPDKTTGVWSYTSNEDLMNKFYTFQVKVNDQWLDETPGVWAKAVGVNGYRAAIIDFSKT